MFRLLKLLIFLGIVGVIALTGYAYLVDLSPQQVETVEPVILNVD